MKTTKLLVASVVWAASLLGVGLWAQGTRATTSPPSQTAPIISSGEPMGPVLTGDSIGLQRLAGPQDRDGKIPVRWMLKVKPCYTGRGSSVDRARWGSSGLSSCETVDQRRARPRHER